LIEVNLLPDGKKRTSRGGGIKFSLPKMGNLPTDPYTMAAVASGLLSAALVAWLFLGVRADLEEVMVQEDEALQDSIRLAETIERTNALIARRDSISARVEIIQQIDAQRYVWPHILDEIGRALPDYTWMTEIVQTSGGSPLQFRIAGQAGSLFAVTNFMENLERSPFFRGVKLLRTEQAASAGSQSDIVNVFEFTLSFEPPPLEELETVPLFTNDVGPDGEEPSDDGED